ncbi:MAG: hypothetical protein V3W41_08395 [Planctomycetota bacterium]
MTNQTKTLVLSAFREPRSSKIVNKGLDIKVHLSPYFFPETLKCSYDPSSGTLVVDFEYMDDEPIDDTPINDDDNKGITIFEGTHTGRPRRMEVQVDLDGIGKVQIMVNNLLSGLEHPKSPEAEPEVEASYELAREAIRDNEKSLQELVAI